MSEKKRRAFDGRIIFGLLVVAVGVLLLLNRLDMGVDFSLHTYWPSILIIIGLWKILSPGWSRDVMAGGLMVVVGSLFQLNNLGYISFWWGDLWPLLIIFVGLSIIQRSFFPGSRKCCGPFGHHGHWHGDNNKNGENDNQENGQTGHGPGHGHRGPHHHNFFSGRRSDLNNETIDVSALFGSGEYRITGKNFRGGNANSVFGAIELDFRNAEIDGDKAFINVSAIFGAVEIRVPQHWEVILEGTPILGAIENKIAYSANTTKKLVIKSSAMFGAVEVKS